MNQEVYPNNFPLELYPDKPKQYLNANAMDQATDFFWHYF